MVIPSGTCCRIVPTVDGREWTVVEVAAEEKDVSLVTPVAEAETIQEPSASEQK